MGTSTRVVGRLSRGTVCVEDQRLRSEAPHQVTESSIYRLASALARMATVQVRKSLFEIG